MWVEENIPSQLRDIHSSFITGVTCHQCTAATHILVFMISNEEWRKKTYAVPVHCLPYKGLADLTVGVLANKIIHKMSKSQIHAGEVIKAIFQIYIYIFLVFVTDGEWNSLRTKGNTRQLLLLQICANVRMKYEL